MATTDANATKDAVNAALARVRELLAKRADLENELLAVEVNLREAWRTVPKMPVRSFDEIEIEERIAERRQTRLLKTARGDRKVASILNDLMYGSENERSLWRA